MRSFKFTRDFYLNKDRPQAKVEFEGGEAYLSEYEMHGKPRFSMIVFLGKQNKPVSNYYYSSVEKRLEALNSQIASCKASMEFKAKMKAERKPSNDGVKVGDIFVNSGGYDQTNTEALQVVELVGKAMVKVRAVGFRVMAGSEGHDSNRVMPVKDSFLDVDPDGKVNQYQFDKGGLRQVIRGYIKGTWGSASKWDGKGDYYNSWGH